MNKVLSKFMIPDLANIVIEYCLCDLCGKDVAMYEMRDDNFICQSCWDS